MSSDCTLASFTTDGHDNSMNGPWIRPLLRRILAEYEAMPGLCLTKSQARRLWDLDTQTCDSVLEALVDVGYVRPTARGYIRA